MQLAAGRRPSPASRGDRPPARVGRAARVPQPVFFVPARGRRRPTRCADRWRAAAKLLLECGVWGTPSSTRSSGSSSAAERPVAHWQAEHGCRSAGLTGRTADQSVACGDLRDQLAARNEACSVTWRRRRRPSARLEHGAGRPAVVGVRCPVEGSPWLTSGGPQPVRASDFLSVMAGAGQPAMPRDCRRLHQPAVGGGAAVVQALHRRSGSRRTPERGRMWKQLLSGTARRGKMFCRR